MKLGNYILEQEISSASCSDIEIAQYFAEMEVAAALLDCYVKQALIMEYSTCDIDEFGIFTEYTHEDALPNELSANKKEKSVGSKMKGIGATLKRWWQAFVNLLKKIVGGVKKVFTATTIDTLIEMVENAPDGTVYEIPKKEGKPEKDIQSIALDFMTIADKYRKFSEIIKSSDTITADNIDSLKYENLGSNSGNGYNKYYSTNNLNIASGGTMSKNVMLAVLQDLKKADVPSNAKTILKDLEAIEKTNIVTLGALDEDDDAIEARKSARADLVKVLKETATKLSKEFNSVSSKLISVQKMIITTGNRVGVKNAKKAEKEANKNS